MKTKSVKYKGCEIYLVSPGVWAVRKESDGYLFSRRFLDPKDARIWLDLSLKYASGFSETFRTAGINNRFKHTRGLGGVA